MNFLRHMSENLFITFTGIAALVHSTWSLGTMFSGVAPSGDLGAYVAWVLPAFFVAFAMDVGQISTSAAIRHNGLTWQRAVTFCSFAIATYYLQFLYIAHHLPAMALAQGISEYHRHNVVTWVDAAIWVLPLFLPLSTILYTLSGGDKKERPTVQQNSEPTIKMVIEDLPLIAEKNTEIAVFTMLEEEIIQEPKYQAHCEDCGWSNEFLSEKTAKRSLTTHKTLHCKNRHEVEEVSQNGHLE